MRTAPVPLAPLIPSLLHGVPPRKDGGICSSSRISICKGGKGKSTRYPMHVCAEKEQSGTERSGWRLLVLASEQASGASACPALRSRSAARLEWRRRGRERGGRTAGSQSIAFDPMKREKTRCVEERRRETSKLQQKDENIL
ncbi:hypothetical protein B0H13DRAFT_1887784 [Mycena leptocephala]|nr:hypothetical protein B0H13DRAFT_1887784 [Mycena leptocephala]